MFFLLHQEELESREEQEHQLQHQKVRIEHHKTVAITNSSELSL